MSVINEIKNIKDEVKDWLTKFPHLRDSDDKLWCSIVSKELGMDKLKSMSGYDLLKLIAEEKVKSFESVSRTSRVIQEKHSELSGERRKKRKALAEEVRKQIHSV
jgi:hypothetical protein